MTSKSNTDQSETNQVGENRVFSNEPKKGDYVGGDKFDVEVRDSHAVAIGAGSRAIINTYNEIIVKHDSIEDLPPVEGNSPYKGMNHFTEQDAAWFIGREALTKHISTQLEKSQFLAIIGASGSGKSSLVRAGIIPYFRKNNWLIHLITPTENPLLTLADTLTRDQLLVSSEQMVNKLTEVPTALLESARKLSSQANSAPFLLIIDQFEELFTLVDDQTVQDAFINNLIHAVSSEKPITLLISLRADFYARIDRFEQLRQLVAQQQEFIGPMNQEELTRAVIEPARLGNWRFAEGLVEQILEDVGNAPGRLPLLSHALLETWKRRRGNVMTLSGYREAGGVRKAIAQTAEETLAQLTEEQRLIAKRVFLSLTELGEGAEDTRRRVTKPQLIPRPELAGEIETILDQLTAARLITSDQDEIEVAHEALIREWPTLREWLEEDRNALRLHRQISKDAKMWQEMDEDVGFLYRRGVRLDLAVDWAAENQDILTPLERRFIEHSQAEATRREQEREAARQRELEQAQQLAKVEQERARKAEQLAEAEKVQAQLQLNNTKRLRRFLVGLSFTLALAIIGAGVAFWQTNVANAARNDAEEAIVSMTALLNTTSDYLYGERAVKIVGLAPIQRDYSAAIFNQIDLIIENADPSNSAWLRAEAYLRIAQSSQEVGNSQDAQRYYELAFDEAVSVANTFENSTNIPSKLLEILSESAVFYAWEQMNLGNIDEAEEILTTAIEFSENHPGDESNANLIYKRSMLENALSRLWSEKGEDETAFAYQAKAIELAREAVALESDNIIYNATLATYLDNQSLSPLLTSDEVLAYEEEGCEIARAVDTSFVTGAALISPLASCIYNESFSQDTDEARKSLSEFIIKLDTIISLDPINIDIKLIRAWLNMRLRRIEWFDDERDEEETKEIADEIFQDAMSDWLSLFSNGSQLPQDVWRLRRVYVDLRNHINDYYEDTDQKADLYGQIVKAIEASSEDYGNAPEIALIAADSMTLLGEQLRLNDNPEGFSYIEKAIELFDNTTLLDDLSTYDERYQWVCNAYQEQIAFSIDKNDSEAVITGLAQLEEVCQPIFEHHQFDFYLNSVIRSAKSDAGEFLFNQGHYEDAISPLKYASYWGSHQSTDLLARIYREGLAGEVDVGQATELEALASRQYDGLKRFTVPVDFGGETPTDFYIYVYDGPVDAKYTGINDQVEWIKVARGGTVPPEVVESFDKLFNIAVENEVSFTELVVYALGEAQADIVFGVTEDANCELVTDIIGQILKEQLDINIDKETYPTKTALIEALVSGDADVTACFVTQDDASQLNQIPNNAIKQIGGITWDSGAGRWQMWANASIWNTWRLAESCTFSILENVRLEPGPLQVSEAADWASNHTEDIESWSACAATQQ